MSCCSESFVSVLVAMALMDSMVAVAANAQQEPHWPWSRTGLSTLAALLQSLEEPSPTLTPLLALRGLVWTLTLRLAWT